MRLVINDCFGGFSISSLALHWLRLMGNAHAIAETDVGELWGHKEGQGTRDSIFSNLFCSDIPRDDSQLIQVVGYLGDKASGRCAELKIVKIPDGVGWQIEEYDGLEHVAEKHRTWR